MMGNFTLHKDSVSTESGRVCLEPAVTVMHVNKLFLVAMEPIVTDQSPTADVFHLTASQC